jgi:hypothetical protein
MKVSSVAASGNRGMAKTGLGAQERHRLIERQILAVQKSILAFQPIMMGEAGRGAAIDTNLAIILSDRLSTVWKRLRKEIPARKKEDRITFPLRAAGTTPPPLPGRPR